MKKKKPEMKNPPGPCSGCCCPFVCNSKMVKLKEPLSQDDLAPFSGLVCLCLTPPKKLA